jgi:hypothetical protein
MSAPGLAKAVVANGAVPKYTIVKLGAAGIATVAAAATDKLMGVSQDVTAATGERFDAQVTGIAWCTAGGVFAEGDPLTSDASGRAVVAAPAAGSNVRLIGYATEAATALGDVVNILLAPGVMQG